MQIIKINTNKKFIIEKKWIIDSLFKKSFKSKIIYNISNEFKNTEIIHQNKKFINYDYYFNDLIYKDKQWIYFDYIFLKLDNLSFLNKVNFIEEDIICFFGKKINKFELKSDCIISPVDILGSAFFLLSGEIEKKNYDKKIGRVSFKKSLLDHKDLIFRPILNEYIFLLGNYFYGSSLKKELNKRYNFYNSCDIDVPYITNINFFLIIKELIKFLLNKNNFEHLIDIFKTYTSKNIKFDPYFKKILEIIEINKDINLTLNFINKFESIEDGFYDYENHEFKYLMNSINSKNINFGLHPNFNSFNSYKNLNDQFNNHKNLISKYNISQNTISSRQHFLKWDPVVTPNILNRVGINVDNSIGFYDHVGFRRGYCYEFNLFDLKSRSVTNVIEYPLIIMDVSIYSKSYMNLILNNSNVIDMISNLINKIKFYEGNMSLLWHNNQLYNNKLYNFYKNLINMSK